MEQVENMIQIYHTCFIVFLILALVFLAATVIMFIVFKIPKVFELRTGKGARKTIQKMKEQNALTGSLRMESAGQTERRPVAREDVITRPKTREITRKTAYTNAAQQAGGTEQTTLLKPEPGAETMLLQPEAGAQTTLLSQAEAASAKAPEGRSGEQLGTAGKFVLGKKIMLVHTDIVI